VGEFLPSELAQLFLEGFEAPTPRWGASSTLHRDISVLDAHCLITTTMMMMMMDVIDVFRSYL